MLEIIHSSENKFIADDKNNPRLYTILTEAVKTLWGVSYDSLSKNFFDIAKETITERFPAITIQDISFAFKTSEIEKKPYTSLTRDEFLNPIKSYWEKKNKLIGELKRIENEEKQIKKRQYFDGIDRVKAIKMYKHLIENNSNDWQDLGGTVYLANSISRDIAKYMDQKYKNRAWNWAKMHHRKDTSQAHTTMDYFVIVPIVEMYYSLYIVRFGLGLNIIPEEFNLPDNTNNTPF